MILAKISQGEVASLTGTPRFCVIYLVGNAVIATDILRGDIRAGMLVPFRIELYEKDKDARTDRMASRSPQRDLLHSIP